ncbi:MAG: methylglyoxal synthase [Bacteroidales bacterium]|nr:methylglyoxal synthase [Bacteroidales bacterium]
MEKRKIAIIAHDGKKAEMVAFLNQNKIFLQHFKLIATGTTGNHVEESGFIVKKYKSGPLGGDAQIGSLVSEGKVAMVFFFRDPLGKHPHEPDVQMLMRLCDVHNIPLATNPATANHLIKGLAHAKQREIKPAGSTFLTKSEKKVLIGELIV